MEATIIRSLLVLLILLTAVKVGAQNGLPPAAANRGMALGNTGVTFTDQFAAWTNPAGLARVSGTRVHLSGEQRFGLEELRLVQLGAAFGAGTSGGFGLNVTSFGYTTLRENRLGVAYGRSLADNFRIGGEIVGFNTSVRGYDSRFAMTFSLGFQVDILPNLSAGMRVFSPLRVELTEGENLPQLLTIGLGYRPNKKLLLLAEADQDLDGRARLKAGLEYLVAPAFQLRLGASSGPAEVSFGAGYRIAESIDLQVAARYHETLGISPGVGLVYRPARVGAE